MSSEKPQKHNYKEQNLGANEQEIKENHQRILESLSPEQKQNYLDTVALVNKIAMDFTKRIKMPFEPFDFWLTQTMLADRNGQNYYHEKTHLIFINENLFSTLEQSSEVNLSNLAILTPATYPIY
jgi:hypothetical protein